MEERRNRLGASFAGVFSAAMGFLIIAAAADWVPINPESLHAPRWVLAAAGAVFVIGGALVLTSEIQESSRYRSPWVEGLRFAGGGVIITLFAAVANWIAFGPGERQFTTTISLPLITTVLGAEGGGRLVFGCGAVLLDLLVLWVWVSGLWRQLRKGSAGQNPKEQA